MALNATTPNLISPRTLAELRRANPATDVKAATPGPTPTGWGAVLSKSGMSGDADKFEQPTPPKQSMYGWAAGAQQRPAVSQNEAVTTLAQSVKLSVGQNRLLTADQQAEVREQCRTFRLSNDGDRAALASVEMLERALVMDGLHTVVARYGGKPLKELSAKAQAEILGALKEVDGLEHDLGNVPEAELASMRKLRAVVDPGGFAHTINAKTRESGRK